MSCVINGFNDVECCCRFQDVEMEDDIAREVSKALARNTSVTFLRFSSNGMGDEQLGLIVPGLVENATLKHLEYVGVLIIVKNCGLVDSL